MRKSKSEETSKLIKKDPVPPYYSTTHNVADPTTNPKPNPSGDDPTAASDPFNPGNSGIIKTSASRQSRQGSVKSSYVTIGEKSIVSASTKEIETQTLKDESLPPPIPPIQHSIIGIIFAFVCAIALSCASFLVKYLDEKQIPPSNSIFWRGPLVVTISTVWLIQLCATSSDRSLVKEVLWPPTKIERFRIIAILILSRVIVGPLSIVTQFYSLKYMHLGDSNTIVFSAAVFVPIFAYCLLHEAWGVVPFFAALVTAIGVMIISKPDFITGKEEKPGSQRYLGFTFAFISMVANIGVYITLRYLHRVPGVILVWLMSITSTMTGLILTLSTEGFVLPKDFVQTSCIVALMTTTAIGQFSLVWALRYEDASMVSLIRCSELVFGFLWQMILGIYPDTFSISGASLVLFSFGLVFFRKYLQQLPYDHKLRHYFKYLLK